MSSIDPAGALSGFQPVHPFCVGVDSDGCVFDTMELKHKECFAPMFVKHFGLAAVGRYAREACEFVNLYSRDRGANRFPAYLKALDLLAEREEVRRRGFRPPACSRRFTSHSSEGSAAHGLAPSLHSSAPTS